MRRSAMMVLVILAWGAGAARAVDYFEFAPYANTKTAGAALSVDAVIARNSGGSIDTGFNGTATLSGSTGAGTVSPTTLSFAGGYAHYPGITCTAAGSVDLTVSDDAGPASNVAGWARVNPGNAAAFLILRHSDEIQQLHTPGVFPGYSTPYPYGVTVTAGIPVAVTVHVIDQYYNTVPGITGNINLDDSLHNGAVVPTTQPNVNGIAEFMWSPDPPSEGQITFELSGQTGSGLDGLTATWLNRWNYVTTQDAYHIWIDGPSSAVVAGVPFPVTVTVSTSNVVRNPTAAGNAYQFRLSPMLAGSSPPAPGHGTLTPSLIDIGDQGVDGKGFGHFTYPTAELIYLDFAVVLPTNPIPTDLAFSRTLDVRAGKPVALALAAAPASVQANKQAVVTATLTDAHANPVPGLPVTFTLLQASDRAYISLTQSATDDAAGQASTVFHAGIVNETALLRARTTGVFGSESYDLQQDAAIDVSVAEPTGDSMLNYPNPFNPLQETTSINYFLQGESRVEIRIYDPFGRMVLSKDLERGEGAGAFANATRAGGAGFEWDGRNGEGKVVGNGIYFVKLTARNDAAVQEFTRRVGVVK